MRTTLTAAVCALSFAACGTSPTEIGDGGDAGAPDAGFQDSGPALLCAVYDAGAISASQIDAGYQLILYYGCQKCHGAELSGNNDGVTDPLSGNLEYPPNLTPDESTGLGCWTDQQVMDAMLNNIDNQGMAICQPMPNFADAGMTVEDSAAIVAYLRAALEPTVNNVPSGASCCLFDLDCGDNGYCSQRECIDGGAPVTATTGASATGSTATATTVGASTTTGTSASSGTTTGAGTTGATTASASTAASTGTTTNTAAAAGTTGGGTSVGTTASTSGTTGATTGGTTTTTDGSTTTAGATTGSTTAAASTGGTTGS